ncbi:hypothetical protein ZWY2020_009771 [Hordeum vulgare]|nr:hypothetical protein ZWY2020_009771 [Hordeum vulgare]
MEEASRFGNAASSPPAVRSGPIVPAACFMCIAEEAKFMHVMCTTMADEFPVELRAEAGETFEFCNESNMISKKMKSTGGTLDSETPSSQPCERRKDGGTAEDVGLQIISGGGAAMGNPVQPRGRRYFLPFQMLALQVHRAEAAEEDGEQEKEKSKKKKRKSKDVEEPPAADADTGDRRRIARRHEKCCSFYGGVKCITSNVAFFGSDQRP